MARLRFMFLLGFPLPHYPFLWPLPLFLFYISRPLVKFEAIANKEQSQAKVGNDGAFSAELAPGDYTVTGSAGFMANSDKKGPGIISKGLKVEADVSNLDLDVGKVNKK